ncbi:MAG: bifunctional 5,10-methylenetetrahydrofolate dehydrogenase/5,10-methenyltetrahydrofolate cyclohydrolase [Parcubacteria group bacterium]|nr:bifunctional 5,10-methylenetetrahydrofolate dehydrogenase/5,10-methenyltetrahydrofolate cyclohydrolase [Parcubacteria group bacterium]
MAKILDGKIIRDKIQRELAEAVSKLPSKPKLVIIQVGDNPDSNAYVNQKKIFGEKIGVAVELCKFDDSIGEEVIAENIEELNSDKSTNGIIVQLPLPTHLDASKLISNIDPNKDVDGLTPVNVRKLFENDPSGFVPATAKGVLSLLDYYSIPLEGKRVTVIGRSVLVGKPIALTLLARNATVTVCHRKTKDLIKETKDADIIIVAAGCPGLISAEHVSFGQTVVDVGINLISGKKFNEEIVGKKFVGDVDFEAVKNIVSAISPVPGGVGPMTVASLFENLLKAIKML